MRQMRNSVHADFERNSDLLLDLFGRNSWPLRDDLDVVVGNVRISFNRKLMKGNCTPNEQQQRNRQHDEAVLQGEINNGANHYCSTVFCITSAFVTTRSPGA